MQKGFGAILILVGILILAGVAGGAYYLGTQKPAGMPVEQSFNTIPSPTPSSTTTPDKTANWKIYTHPDFTFKYPDNWYPDNHPDFPSGNNVGFFLVGTKADHGYGDHKGNDIFAFEASNDTRSLEELKSNYYPDAINVTVGGKPAIRTSFNLYLISYSTNKKLNVVGGKQEAKKYVDQILSTLKFTQ